MSYAVSAETKNCSYNCYGITVTSSYARGAARTSIPGNFYGHTRLLGGCGLGGMWSFGGMQIGTTYVENAEFLAALYREFFGPGYVIYAITDGQVAHSDVAALLLKAGAKELINFPNLCHGPHKIHLYIINTREFAGVWCTKEGVPFKEPPENPQPLPVTVGMVAEGGIAYALPQPKGVE
jgi:hypothetical protein